MRNRVYQQVANNRCRLYFQITACNNEKLSQMHSSFIKQNSRHEIETTALTEQQHISNYQNNIQRDSERCIFLC